MPSVGLVELILGVVGSPRKGKLTDRLVTKCLEGAQKAGVECEKIYLIDYQVPFYTEETRFPERLNDLWEKSDALIIGAPVYWGGINGLTKDFMDSLKICDVNGKYGLGIAVAGGTGRGLCSGVQNIYRFFYHRRMRAVDPTPVSRFNFDKVFASIYEAGRKLAELSKERMPFEGDKDRMEYYERLDYLNFTYLDEVLLLTNQLVDISGENLRFSDAKEEYEKARSLIMQGRRTDAVEHATKSYNMLYFDPPKA